MENLRTDIVLRRVIVVAEELEKYPIPVLFVWG